MAKKKQSGKKSRKLTAKQKTVRLGLATMAAVSGVAAYQVIAATASVPIIARLVRAVELTVNTTLDFGTLAMTAERPGHATIDPEVNRLFVEDTGSLTLAGGKPSAGRLFIKGAEFPVHISLADTTVKLTNGTNSVVVGNFNLMTAKGGTKMTFTPTENTYSFTIPVGATLQTRARQVSGTYVGMTRIFASYQ